MLTLSQAEIDRLDLEQYSHFLVDGELEDLEEDAYLRFLLSHLIFDL